MAGRETSGRRFCNGFKVQSSRFNVDSLQSDFVKLSPTKSDQFEGLASGGLRNEGGKFEDEVGLSQADGMPGGFEFDGVQYPIGVFGLRAEPIGRG